MPYFCLANIHFLTSRKKKCSCPSDIALDHATYFVRWSMNRSRGVTNPKRITSDFASFCPLFLSPCPPPREHYLLGVMMTQHNRPEPHLQLGAVSPNFLANRQRELERNIYCCSHWCFEIGPSSCHKQSWLIYETSGDYCRPSITFNKVKIVLNRKNLLSGKTTETTAQLAEEALLTYLQMKHLKFNAVISSCLKKRQSQKCSFQWCLCILIPSP